MGFITKNANILLLFLILVSSVALVFSTVFFQSNFDKINEEYNDKMAELQKASSELNSTKHILLNYREELSLKSAREKEFGEQFSVVQTEKQKIATEKEKLAAQKESLDAELTTTEQEKKKLKNELSSKLSLISSLENDLAECEADKDDCEADLTAKESELDDCEQELDDCNCTS